MNNFKNVTTEQKRIGREASIAKRNEQIKEAIQNGAQVSYMSVKMSADEIETIIIIDSEGVLIDTTNKSHMVKFMKRGYEIVGISYYKDIIQGMSFKTTENKLSFRN